MAAVPSPGKSTFDLPAFPKGPANVPTSPFSASTEAPTCARWSSSAAKKPSAMMVRYLRGVPQSSFVSPSAASRGDAADIPRSRRAAATPRIFHGALASRGDAAATTWTFHGAGSPARRRYLAESGSGSPFSRSTRPSRAAAAAGAGAASSAGGGGGASAAFGLRGLGCSRSSGGTTQSSSWCNALEVEKTYFL